MLRSMLLLSLIVIEAGCAGKAPAPPPSETCLTLKDHFRCRRADGTKYSDPYPGKVMREARPVTDEEAQRNYQEALRK